MSGATLLNRGPTQSVIRNHAYCTDVMYRSFFFLIIMTNLFFYQHIFLQSIFICTMSLYVQSRTLGMRGPSPVQLHGDARWGKRRR